MAQPITHVRKKTIQATTVTLTIISWINPIMSVKTLHPLIRRICLSNSEFCESIIPCYIL
ncbi:hypothetical protein D3C81_2263870 [compost metagenome]